MDLSLLGEKLHRHFPHFPNLLPLKKLGEGFGSLVVESSSGIVFRVAKNEIAQHNHRKEAKMLPLLRDKIALKLPFPEYGVETDEDFPFGLIGYQKIEGTVLSPGDVTPNNVQALAAQTAHFLYQLHHLPTLPDLPIIMPDTSHLARLKVAVDPFLRSHLTEGEYARLNHWWDESMQFWQTNQPPIRLIHGDAWYENFVVDTDRNIVGVLDFEGLAMGDPAVDFVPQQYISVEFAQAVIGKYARLGGDFGQNLEERMKRLAGLRELGGLEYGLQINNVDEDTLDKIRSTVI